MLYLPFDVINSLKLKEDDEVGFFKTENRSFLFVKNSDITSMLQGNTRQEEPVKPKPAETSPRGRQRSPHRTSPHPRS